MRKRQFIIRAILFMLFMGIATALTVCTAIYIAKPNTKTYVIEVGEKVTKVEKEESVDTVYVERGTTYNAVPSQCDNNPFTTADGSIIDPNALLKKEIRWVAMSRDLIKDSYRDQNYPSVGHWKGEFEFGDTIVVSSSSSPQINGMWIVHDTMNKRYKKSIDFLFAPQNNKPKLGVCRDIKIIKYDK